MNIEEPAAHRVQHSRKARTCAPRNKRHRADSQSSRKKREATLCIETRLMPRRSFSAISIVSARLYGELPSRAEAGVTVRIHGPPTPRTPRICCAQGLLAQQLNGAHTFSDTAACEFKAFMGTKSKATCGKKNNKTKHSGFALTGRGGAMENVV